MSPINRLGRLEKLNLKQTKKAPLLMWYAVLRSRGRQAWEFADLFIDLSHRSRHRAHGAPSDATEAVSRSSPRSYRLLSHARRGFVGRTGRERFLPLSYPLLRQETLRASSERPDTKPMQAIRPSAYTACT